MQSNIYNYELQIIWTILLWIFQHRKYYGIFVMMIEYCVRIMLLRVPKKEEEKFESIFRLFGIDVHHANFHNLMEEVFFKNGIMFPIMLYKAVGEIPMIVNEIPQEIVSFLNEAHNGMYIQNTLKKLNIEDMIKHISDNINKIALKLPDEMLKKIHYQFAEFLLQTKPDLDTRKDDTLKKSRELYNGSTWFDLGFPVLKAKMNHTMTKEQVEQLVQEEFDRWTSWALKFQLMLKEAGPIFFSEIKAVLQYI